MNARFTFLVPCFEWLQNRSEGNPLKLEKQKLIETRLFVELNVFRQPLRKYKHKLDSFMAAHKRVVSSTKFINCCNVFFENLKRNEN